MSIEIKLPELGDGIESGDVLEVLVSVGDTIEQDQAIIEIETDKATVEVPSSARGRVAKVHVSAGQSIPIGAALITLEAEQPAADDSGQQKPVAESTQVEPAGKSAAPPAQSPRPAASEKRSTDQAPPNTEPPQAPRAVPSAPSPATSSLPPAASPAASPIAVPSQPAAAMAAADRNVAGVGDSVAPAGPAVRRLAREVGIELSRVKGTGPGGRITREDVLSAVRQAAQAATITPLPPREDATTANSSADTVATPPLPGEAWGPVDAERMSKIRKTISRKMFQSWTTVPRVTNFDDADVTDLERIRQASKTDYAARGIKLTAMPFVIKAVAMALTGNPSLNAEVDEEHEQIIYKRYVHIGIAVDTSRGLVVPSLRNADQLSIPDIARGLSAIAEKARQNEFSIDDLRGSTFTISNLGAIGGTYSTPIINTPGVAILLLGRSRQMPVVVDGEIRVRLMMPLSLSYDHRLVDGAAAARFLNDVISYLQAPSRLLIAP